MTTTPTEFAAYIIEGIGDHVLHAVATATDPHRVAVAEVLAEATAAGIEPTAHQIIVAAGAILGLAA